MYCFSLMSSLRWEIQIIWADVYDMCVCSVAQSCPTLCDPMDCSPLGSSALGILQTRILEWVAISSFRGYAWPGNRIHSSCVSCIARWVLYHWAIGHGNSQNHTAFVFLGASCHWLGSELEPSHPTFVLCLFHSAHDPLWIPLCYPLTFPINYCADSLTLSLLPPMRSP